MTASDSGARRHEERPAVDVLIPTYRRPTALAMTLAGLAGQSYDRLRIVISDQTEDDPLPSRSAEVEAVVRVLDASGRRVERHHHVPSRGMAEQRRFLLRRADAPYALFIDDDVLLEPDLVERLVAAIRRARCGFVGSALIGLSFRDDVRPREQAIEFWDGPVRPEWIRPGTAAWERHRLHNAANLLHLREELRPTEDRLYKVAWVGGCVLYDVDKLRASGGFSFWRQLPVRHSGEDVLAQLQVMGRYGGCGLFPSGAYHLEVPTTIAERRVDAPRVLVPSTRVRSAARRRQSARRSSPRSRHSPRASVR
ncbi:MAG TPA: glycosyltransferase family A protein [Candidatus Limnocylindrales bacterium]